jgi:hypothetical protein
VIALGGLLAGGGTLLGTGAFSTVTAERSVSLQTAGDANAFLGLEVLDDTYVEQTDGTIGFDILAESTTTFADLVNVRNNGTQAVTSLRFAFEVTGADQSDDAVETALKIVSGDASIDAVDEVNLLTESDAGGAADDVLTPGEAVPFGIAVDLIDAEDITLTIIADTGGENDSSGENPGDGQPDTYEIQTVSVSNGSGNDIDVTITTDTTDPEATLLIESVRSNPPGNQSPIRDSQTVDAVDGTYSVLGSNGDQADEVRVTLRDGDSNNRAVTTVPWPP